MKSTRYVGIAENVGHMMTFKVLTDDTNKIIYRSEIRSALDSTARNLRADKIAASMETDLDAEEIIKSPRKERFQFGNRFLWASKT